MQEPAQTFPVHAAPSACKINLSPSLRLSASRTAAYAYKTAGLRVMHQDSCRTTPEQCSQAASVLYRLL